MNLRITPSGGRCGPAQSLPGRHAKPEPRPDAQRLAPDADQGPRMTRTGPARVHGSAGPAVRQSSSHDESHEERTPPCTPPTTALHPLAPT